MPPDARQSDVSTSKETTPSSAPQAPEAILLAAGKGKRMGSDLPKVVLRVGGKPMVWWVVQACRDAGVGRIIVVIGHGGQEVVNALAHFPGANIEFVEQKEQLGTGHAARMAEHLFESKKPADVFVLAGDGPLIRADTLNKLLAAHRKHHASATLATAILENPTGYGRIVRNADGSFNTIVEQKDATEAQRAIREINPSYYCFRSDDLFRSLGQVKPNNSQAEFYLTDVPSLLKAEKKTVAVVDAVPPEDVLSINDPVQLAEVDAIMRARLAGVGGSR